MIYVYLILGLFVGSFLNVVILRFKNGERGILSGRSRCPECKKNLAWFELVPVLSFIFLRGQCLHCKKPISIQYPLVELLTGVMFSALFWKFGSTWQFLILAIITGILIILFVYDLLTQTIPDIVAYLGIGFALVYLLTTNYSQLITALIAAALAGGFFAALVLISKEKWMGKGDIKLGILMGLVLSYPNVLVGLFFAFVLGSIVGLILIALKKKTLQSQIPFGPFLIIAIFVTIFYGELILKWYLGLINI